MKKETPKVISKEKAIKEHNLNYLTFKGQVDRKVFRVFSFPLHIHSLFAENRKITIFITHDRLKIK